MSTRPSGPERADKLLCKIAREYMRSHGGYVFQGSDSDLLESDNPRAREAVQFAQRVLEMTNPRLAKMASSI